MRESEHVTNNTLGFCCLDKEAKQLFLFSKHLFLKLDQSLQNFIHSLSLLYRFSASFLMNNWPFKP